MHLREIKLKRNRIASWNRKPAAAFLGFDQKPQRSTIRGQRRNRNGPSQMLSLKDLTSSDQKICQRFMLSSFRMPCLSQGSFFIFSLTSFSSSALKIKREPPSSTKGPPIKIKPSATSRSINSACSSQNGCSRVVFDKSRFGPAEEITTNVFFIIGKPSASVHRVQPRMFH